MLVTSHTLSLRLQNNLVQSRNNEAYFARRKMKLKEGTSLAQGHTVSQHGSWI